MLALVVLDRHVADAVGHAAEERLDVGVVVLVLDDLVAHRAADEPEVARLQPLGTREQDLRRRLVEPAAEVLERPVRGLPVHAVDDVVAFLHLFEDDGNLRGMGLQVVVHAHDEVAMGVVHPAHEGVVLAEVAHEGEREDVVPLARELRDDREGVVGGAVVHQHELAVVAREPLEHLGAEPHDGTDALARAIAGYDYGDQHDAPNCPGGSGGLGAVTV